jgi:DNA-binding NtrC family response regulator
VKIPENSPASVKAKEARPTVLVVDDDANILSALVRALRNEPYEVLTTADPFQAVEWMKSRPVDVVIADEFMPAMRGTELLEAAARFAPRSAKIVLTGYPAALVGANLIIPKPWEDQLLRRSLRLLLDAARARAS